jgi:hypothetical protein
MNFETAWTTAYCGALGKLQVGAGRLPEFAQSWSAEMCLEAVGQSIAGEESRGAVSSRTYKFQTAMPPGVAAPNTIETRFGTLNLLDGIPDKASTEKLYDNLDFQHAVQAYLLGLPAVNQAGNRSGILQMGPANTTVPIWEQRVDSRTVELTANDNTPYTWFWVDLRGGPLVIEVPPKVLGLVDDMWYRWAGDIGTSPGR